LTARLPRRGRAHSRAGSCLDGEPSYFDGTPSNQPDQLAGPGAVFDSVWRTKMALRGFRERSSAKRPRVSLSTG